MGDFKILLNSRAHTGAFALAHGDVPLPWEGSEGTRGFLFVKPML